MRRVAVPLDGEREQMARVRVRLVFVVGELEAIAARRGEAEALPHKAFRSALASELARATGAASLAANILEAAARASDDVRQWHGDDLSSCDCESCATGDGS